LGFYIKAEGIMVSVPLNKLSRQERKRLKTKDDLLIAAQELFLQYGVGAVTINQITEKADIGLGTFYNYFTSKTNIVDGLVESIAHGYYREIDAVTMGLDDPAKIVSASILHTFNKAKPGSNWGKLLFDLGAPIESIITKLQTRAINDWTHGIDAGRFNVDNVPVMLAIHTGGFLSVAKAIYHEKLPLNSDKACAQKMLEMLGIGIDEAERIVSIPQRVVKTYDLPVSLLD